MRLATNEFLIEDKLGKDKDVTAYFNIYFVLLNV